jgi:hypothetical protein
MEVETCRRAKLSSHCPAYKLKAQIARIRWSQLKSGPQRTPNVDSRLEFSQERPRIAKMWRQAFNIKIASMPVIMAIEKCFRNAISGQSAKMAWTS